ncbi:MAG: poly-gamma-glutamate biosynthesis protein PgsC [Tissierellia bacterium]|nr:poly-gamma-glutamate biosynthesis protein PgsC [Tissierellia bacterium]MDD4725943.1 poly-gamma-glutamate biosynthesis protein PgsC [Tissierellia bacterium]
MYKIIILGVIISIIYYEITEVSPGGIIVPGYIALYLNQPDRILATILLSIITLAIVNILSKHIIIYGKRRFGITIITSLMLSQSIQKAISFFSFSLLFATTSIGFVIPGLIAQDVNKQGILKTLTSMIFVAIIVRLIDILLVYGVML